VRVSAERVFALVRHLTERDREIVLRLYDQQVLTTDQLTLLFFSSRRRAQDRLLFLYRERVVDRFYPPSRFGAGKPQAHWLLDEAGALLVAAMLRVERKRLGWQRREDWRSHPQLAHRLESNRFVTDLIAVTLPDPTLGVTAWYSTRDAAERLLGDRKLEWVRPDAGFILDTPRGPIECYLEWDRGTETGERLMWKLDHYRLAEARLHYDASEACNVLFVVPGPGRIATLRRAFAELEPRRERHRESPHLLDLDGRWPLLAATAADLGRHGPLGRIWQSITDEREPRRAPAELSPRTDLGATDLCLALGRRWRHDHPSFWDRLSPLGRPVAPEVAETASNPAQPCAPDVPNRAGATSDADPAELQHPAPHNGSYAADLRPSGAAGLMPDPEDDLDHEEASSL
jgi:Replication-relaxation